MDPLTHTLLGANLAELPPARRTRCGTAALLLGANLPDVDVLSYAWGEDAARAFRRGLTHGVLAMLLLPALLALGLWAWDRWRPRGPSALGDVAPRVSLTRLLGLSTVGVWSHPLLDWVNTYGIRLAMPFDDRWFYGDSVFIIDPWLWLALGGTLVVARRGRGPGGVFWVVLAALASVPVLGTGAFVPTSARIAWIAGLAAITAVALAAPPRWNRVASAAGLALAALYGAGMVTLGRVAPELAAARLDAAGVAGVERLMTAPLPARPLVWDVLAATPEGYRFGRMRWLDGGELTLDPRTLPRPADSPVVAAAAAAPAVRGRLDWMRFPWVEVEELADGWSVVFRDARYVREPIDRGFATARVRWRSRGRSARARSARRETRRTSRRRAPRPRPTGSASSRGDPGPPVPRRPPRRRASRLAAAASAGRASARPRRASASGQSGSPRESRRGRPRRAAAPAAVPSSAARRRQHPPRRAARPPAPAPRARA